MLKMLTSDVFAEWFAALDDQAAEDVATALDVIEQLGPAKAPPGSRESLLWYEHPTVTPRMVPGTCVAASLSWDLEAWGCFRDYAKKVLAQLESERFAARLSRLGAQEAATVLSVVRQIKRATDPRLRWTLKLSGHPSLREVALAMKVLPETACDEVRSLYFEALRAAGFEVADVPAHSLALREFSRRVPAPAFRLLYGVDVERETALVVLGEWLDKSFYGDSVRRAERLWKQYVDGQLRAVQPAPAR
jgi:hypothetical protein